MRIGSWNELLEHDLKDLHSAEKQIIEALPAMIEGASSDDLRKALEEHLEVTREQMNRLKEILSQLKMRPGNSVCKGMEGLIQEGQDMLQNVKDPMIRDAAILSAAQKVEHYEMVAYESARIMAEQLGMGDIAGVLEATLKEETATDRRLSKLSKKMMEEKVTQ